LVVASFQKGQQNMAEPATIAQAAIAIERISRSTSAEEGRQRPGLEISMLIGKT
jgi:hypothetical protein